jgi:hypothetical protein
VQLKELVEIELGRLQNLDLDGRRREERMSTETQTESRHNRRTHLANKDVLQGVDALARLLNLPADNLRDELVHQLLQVAARRLAHHNLEHLLANLPDLTRLGVGGLLNLVRPLLSEADREETEEVAIGGLDVNVSLDEGLPFADEGAEFVGGEVHAVEVGEAVLALDLVNTELDLPEGVLVILVEVGERELKDATLKRVVGVLCASGRGCLVGDCMC